MSKIRVAVLYGGISAEREVSLVTGKAIFNNLNRRQYLPSLVELAHDRSFWLVKNEVRLRFDFFKDIQKFDLVFIALHGTLGEDGSIQGLLESLGIPYTGSKVLASALAMDKTKSGQLFLANGLPHPHFVSFTRADWKQGRKTLINKIKKEVGFPMVLKPTDQGSAVGVSIVKNSEQLLKAVVSTLKSHPNLMVQQFVQGREATCGVLEKGGEAFALPPTRIIANLGEFYTYESKYSAGGSTHVCPADFGREINKKIQELALAAHNLLGCRGMSRTDIFVADTGKLFLLEINTIPGMTPTSLFPEAAGKMGIIFPVMLDLIIKAALRQS